VLDSSAGPVPIGPPDRLAAMDPLVEVRELLAIARDEGLEFGEAWALAFDLADPDWQEPLGETLDAWRASYTGAPASRAAEAAALLAEP
jgi:hypothetical protein